VEFHPIDIDSNKNKDFMEHPECLPILEIYTEFYKKTGYDPPWIGYFVSEQNELRGFAGFKGKPQNGKVEIAYATFSQYEGKGMGTATCKHLVELALSIDPATRVTARTLQDGHASIRILQKNGFVCNGIVMDDEDGEVLEWEWKN
jgi:RimJ/RimL family protein N-acetyltransferase